MIALLSIVALASMMGATNAACPALFSCAQSSGVNPASMGGSSWSYFYCDNFSGQTPMCTTVAPFTCPAPYTGPFSDSACNTPLTPVVASPSPVVASPPPVLKNITCNQYTKVSTPVTNTSSFGPYRPSIITYNVCYSTTILQSYTSGANKVSLYTSDIGGFPHRDALNVTQNIILANITTLAQCNSFVASVMNLAVKSCPCLGVTGCSCSAQYYCCDSPANCNTPIWYSGAGKIAVSTILLALSLIAAISAGIF